MDDTIKINVVPLSTDRPEAGLDHQPSEQEIEYRTLMCKFWFASIISIPVMIFSYPGFDPGLKEWMSRERLIVGD